MATLWRSLVCRRVITDVETNSATYVDSVEGFRVPKVPHPFPPVFVVTVWRRNAEHERIRVRLRVQGPSQEDLFVFEVPEQEPTAEFHRHNVRMGGFGITQAGDHHILVEEHTGKNWKTIGMVPVRVQLAEMNNPVERGSKPTGKSSKKSAD